MAPFITEELWHSLGLGQSTIQLADWPSPDGRWGDPASAGRAAATYESAARARNLRAEFNIPSAKKLRWLLRPKADWISAENHVLRALLNASSIEIVGPRARVPKGTPSCLTDIGEFFLPLEGVIDIEAERQRLAKELARAKSDLDKIRVKLTNPAFVEKVPPGVLEEHRARERRAIDAARHIEERLASLK